MMNITVEIKPLNPFAMEQLEKRGLKQMAEYTHYKSALNYFNAMCNDLGVSSLYKSVVDWSYISIYSENSNYIIELKIS